MASSYILNAKKVKNVMGKMEKMNQINISYFDVCLVQGLGPTYLCILRQFGEEFKIIQMKQLLYSKSGPKN